MNPRADSVFLPFAVGFPEALGNRKPSGFEIILCKILINKQ
jgi:hypothetical protein